jgi:hypothetical protein
VSTCRSCQAQVVWLRNTTTGKSAPIDQALVPDGNIVVDLEAGTYRVLTGDAREDAVDRGDPLHFNHFITCPQAPAWKGRTRAGQG